MNMTAWIDFDGTIVDAMPRYYNVLLNYLKIINQDKQIEKLSYSLFKTYKRKGMKEHDIVKRTCGISLNIDKYTSFKKEWIEKKEYLKKDKFIGCPARAFELMRINGYKVNILTQRRNADNFCWELEELCKTENSKFYNESICVIPEKGRNPKYGYLKDNAFENDIIIGDGKLEMQAAYKLGLTYYMVDSGFICWKFCKINCYENYNEVAEHIGLCNSGIMGDKQV